MQGLLNEFCLSSSGTKMCYHFARVLLPLNLWSILKPHKVIFRVCFCLLTFYVHIPKVMMQQFYNSQKLAPTSSPLLLLYKQNKIIEILFSNILIICSVKLHFCYHCLVSSLKAIEEQGIVFVVLS